MLPFCAQARGPPARPAPQIPMSVALQGLSRVAEATSSSHSFTGKGSGCGSGLLSLTVERALLEKGTPPLPGMVAQMFEAAPEVGPRGGARAGCSQRACTRAAGLLRRSAHRGTHVRTRARARRLPVAACPAPARAEQTSSGRTPSSTSSWTWASRGSRLPWALRTASLCEHRRQRCGQLRRWPQPRPRVWHAHDRAHPLRAGRVHGYDHPPHTLRPVGCTPPVRWCPRPGPVAQHARPRAHACPRAPAQVPQFASNLSQLLQMGFTFAKAAGALALCRNDAGKAADLLCSFAEPAHK